MLSEELHCVIQQYWTESWLLDSCVRHLDVSDICASERQLGRLACLLQWLAFFAVVAFQQIWLSWLEQPPF